MFKKLILLGFLGIAPVCAQAQNIGIINPQTNASALTTGTLPAGRMPALTGDVTSSAGSVATTLSSGSASNLNSGTLAVARGGVDQTAWSTYTPTATCGTGTITTDTISGRYKLLSAKTMVVQITLAISTLGTCTGNVNLSTPPGGVNATGANYPGIAINGNALTGAIIPVLAQSTPTILMVFSVGIAANTYYLSVIYETT